MGFVVGIDGCKTEWIAVALDPSGAVSAHFLATIDVIGEVLPGAAGIGIDIPIDLPARGRRPADIEARAALGVRRNSLFFTPVRAAVEAATHALACEASTAAGAGGISQQAFRLGPKILEVAAWLPRARCPVWEVHPELSFSVLLGAPATFAKSTWAGIEQRRRALADAGVHLEDLDVEAGRRAAPDDMVDAAVCAWSARRLVAGEGRSFPADPPHGAAGRPIAIWA